ncbi:MAG: hypothetical protein QF519_06415, partial [Candidatus Poseidoniia archaeon]|nr:hypothetical protein [Candidatus Poseidoniia archaeon]
MEEVGELCAQQPLLQRLGGVGGPGATKDFFITKEYLHYELRDKILDSFDTGYTEEAGLRELVTNASGRLGKDSSTPLWNYTTGWSVNSSAISADGEYIAAG